MHKQSIYPLGKVFLPFHAKLTVETENNKKSPFLPVNSNVPKFVYNLTGASMKDFE